MKLSTTLHHRSIARASSRVHSKGLSSAETNHEGGFALVVVLLVLLALLVLTTPYLASARDADRASGQLADRAAARLGLDSASRRARSTLSDSYPSADMDRTPYWDDLDEIKVDNHFAPGFYDVEDPHGPMWDVDLDDVAGRIDLNSASPHVVANLLDLSTRFTQVVAGDAKELPLSGRVALEPTGFLWCEGELISYTKMDEAVVTKFVRGVFGPAEKTEWRGGPKPTGPHGAGTAVVDQRAFAPVLWRTRGPDGDLRTYESIEELPQCGLYARALQLAAGESVAAFPGELIEPLVQSGSVHAGLRAGPRWQRATRLQSKIEAKKDGRLRVDSTRWLNVGATVRIHDGQTSEIALVQNVLNAGEIALDRVLENDYEAFTAVVDVLARRPVNVNTAARGVLVALFQNLQITGRNSRITNDEASDLADLVIESRPFTGLEDFLRRIVLPSAGIEKLPTDAPVHPDKLAAGTGFIDPWDALALYTNALNANDATLAYSTMPFSFTTRDTYAYELRSTINADSGVERFTMVRDEVALVAPQKELVRLWARQEDFDEELRLSLDAPWWATGPNSTTRYDNGSVPPSRIWAHMGTAEGRVYVPGVTDTSMFQDRASPPVPEHVFASRENQSFVQLMTLREDDESFERRKGRVLHFDNETRDLEGRYLPDQVVTYPTDDKAVQWTFTNATVPNPLLRPIAVSMWIRPRALGDAKYLDVGGTSAEVDRVSLSIESGDLVLRVVDGFGDHRDSLNKEYGELRYALSGSDSPGLPTDVWTHVEIDVRGNRPSQMHMLVNGLAHGVRTPGLTRLTGSLAQSGAAISVESTEGFPPTCVVRIGNELIEVQTTSKTTFDATPVTTGKLAGFGGRTARERMQTLSDTEPMVPVALAGIETSHPSGTPVELYGYALPTRSAVPTGMSEIAGELGAFRVARAIGVVGGQGALGEPITIGFTGATIGNGMKGIGSTVTGLVLASADDALDASAPTPSAEFMSAFQRDGGYALIVQAGATQNNTALLDNAGAPVGGMEIIRYSGWSDTTLNIAQRGVSASQLPNLANLPAAVSALLGGQRSFITRWRDLLGVAPPFFEQIDKQVFVLPISLGVPGSGGVIGFLSAAKGNSQFAQITRIDDAENTEWVRYDHFDTSGMQLVRDDPDALLLAYRCLVHRAPDVPPGIGAPPGGGGPGAPPSEATSSIARAAGSTDVDDASKIVAVVEPALASDAGALVEPDPTAATTLEPTLAPAAQQSTTAGAWETRLGKTDNPMTRWPITRVVETVFQFRGVFGTYSHKHANGTKILPVFSVSSANFDGGKPGRLDTIFLSGPNPDHPGWPVRVHRAHVPAATYEVLRWTQPSGSLGAVADSPVNTNGSQVTLPLEGNLLGVCWVALQDRSPEIINPGTVGGGGSVPILDSRLFARLSCFPSGERPRAVSRVTFGGGANGAPGNVPSAVLDEVVFGDAQFGRKMPIVDPEDVAGASLLLRVDCDENSTRLEVEPRGIRIALGNRGAEHDFLSDLPADGGLLRIGDEILAYQTLDASTGEIRVATNGRGLLGTRAQPHQLGEPLMFLEQRCVTVLGAGTSAGDARLTIAALDDFPREGTVLVGDELITYTRRRDGVLEMPRGSSVPGKMDARADGLFRGRFGTTPATHASGEAVVLFPTRYPDRWAPRADAPELSYFGLSIDQPAAFWNAFFFSKVDTDGSRIGVLQRTRSDEPWDADPDTDKYVKLFWQGEKEGGKLPIGVQSDRVDWRVFVDYQPGAFDARTGMAHGWKQTPRLKMFSAFYHAPSMVLRSVER